MRFATHNIALSVLLALVLGHASIAVHAAAHDSGDIAECDLCIAYGDASETLDSCQEHGVPTESDTHALPVGRVWQSPQPVFSARQRGPPAIH